MIVHLEAAEPDGGRAAHDVLHLVNQNAIHMSPNKENLTP
jgi:hypothetical protein